MFNSHYREQSVLKGLSPNEGVHNYSPIQALQEQLNQASKNKMTGLLEIKANENQKWNAYFYFGRMIWISGNWHQARRLYRQLKFHNPQIDLRSVNLNETDEFCLCEFQVLQALKEQNLLTEEQVRKIVKSIAMEVLFDIFSIGLKSELDFFIVQDTISISLSTLKSFQLDINSLLPHIAAQIDTWCQARLQSISPNDAPKLSASLTSEQQESKSFQKLASKINSQRTIRDLAIGFKLDLLKFTTLLLPYIEKGWIQIAKTADLSYFPAMIGKIKNNTISAQSPVIACIDDSPQTLKMMEPIVKTAGYQFFAIQDSTQALLTLIELKPSLIFLDVMMPIANGYEICAQLRRIPQFDRTPIIILTADRGITNRLRASTVKADEFLPKPIQANKVLSMINKHFAMAA